MLHVSDIIISEVAIVSLTSLEEYTSVFGLVRKSEPAIVHRDEISHYK